MLRGRSFRLVDVFTRTPLSGNGLAVFPASDGLDAPTMQRLTQEMRQFESIFLFRDRDPSTFAARIFTVTEELAFAGHPVLGACAVLHEMSGEPAPQEWRLLLGRRPVHVTTALHAGWTEALMDQGAPEFGTRLQRTEEAPFLEALCLAPSDRAAEYPMEVVSTGLPYLVVPVRSALGRAGIRAPGIEALLGEVGARFAYLLDVVEREGRTWENDGRLEDAATGSAAGPAAAFLVRHGAARTGEAIVIRQGRFLGRPSEMRALVHEGAGSAIRVEVGGDVCAVARGSFD